MVDKEAWSLIAHNGFSLKELKDNGFSLKELIDNGFSPKDNRFSPKELKDVRARYLKRIRDVRFNGRLKDVIAFCYNGFTLKELIDAGFSSDELKDVGARCLKTHEDLPLTISVGLEDIYMPLKTLYNAPLLNDVVRLGFSLKYINDNDNSEQYLRNIGLFLRKLYRYYGVSLKELTEVITDFGFRLRDLGFSPKDLAYDGLSPDVVVFIDSGFSLSDFIDDGLALSDFIDDGLSPRDLRDHRYSLKELIDSGFSLKELIDNGISFKSTPWRYQPYRLIDTSISFAVLNKLNEVGSPPYVLRDTGLSFKQLKDNGFSISELMRIVSLKELLSIGLSFNELKDDGFSIDGLKKAGLSLKELKQAGASPNDFWNVGYSIEEIFKLGYTYGDIRNVYKEYKYKVLVNYQLENFEKLKQLKKLLQKCKPPGFFKHRDRDCTYAQTQSRKGGKKTNKRSRQRK